MKQPSPFSVSRLLGAIFVCALVVAILSIEQSDERARSRYFSNALSSNASITVVADGTAYDVRRGTIYASDGTRAARADILALAYEKLAAARDPIMAIPGISPDSLDAALAELSRTSQALAAKQASPRAAADVSNALYPIDFLRQLSRAEAARLQFLHSGADADARAYEDATRTAFDSYFASLARFRVAFERNVPPDSRAYATESYAITRQNSLAALTVLEAGARASQQRFEERLACVRGRTSACQVRDIALPTVARIASADVSAAAIARAQHIESIEAIAGVPLLKDEPFFAIASSSCMHAKAAALFRYFDSSPSAAPIVVGDARFLPTAAFAHLPFFDFFAARGIPYVESDPLSYYNCPVLDTDLGALEAVRSIWKEARENPLSAYASGTGREELRADEARLAAPLVSEHDARAYVADALDLAQKGALESAGADAATSLALALRDNSGGLLQTIQEINAMEGADLALSEQRVDFDFSALYLFFVRSAFPALYLEANPSATGEHGGLFPGNGLSASELPFIYYSSAPPSLRTALEQSLGAYLRMHFEGR